jgi:anti-sigma factor RsiW
MQCGEFHVMAHGYALGVLSQQDDRRCRAHLADPGPHDACPEALARANATVAWLAGALQPVHPGELVWRRLARQLGLRDEGQKPMLRREQLAWVLAVAGLVVTMLVWMRLHTLEQEINGRRPVLATPQSVPTEPVPQQ